jgi:hypothetical protein
MQSVFEVLSTAPARRPGRQTGQRVHRYTKTPAGGEGGFWQPFDRKLAGRYMQAAEKFDRLQRLAERRGRTGRKNGALGHVALEVLRELLRLVDQRTGRLDPALATIAVRIGRSIAAVAAALKRLKAHGFVDWLRRYVPTGRAGLRGPQVEQTSNAYRLSLPTRLAAGIVPPLPEDDTQRRQCAAQEARAMIAVLQLDEQPAHLTDDPLLAAALARLGRSIMCRERDSTQSNESNQS